MAAAHPFIAFVGCRFKRIGCVRRIKSLVFPSWNSICLWRNTCNRDEVCFDVRCTNISVSLSSSDSDSELRAIRSAIAHFARLQETASQCALALCYAVFGVLRLPAMLCMTLRLPASQCAPGIRMCLGQRHIDISLCISGADIRLIEYSTNWKGANIKRDHVV